MASFAAPSGSVSGEFYRISRTPVDRTAAKVVSKGERHEPFGKAAVAHIFHSEVCPAIVLDKSLRLTSANLTGIKFGRFTVIGMSRDIKGQENTGGRWVVRCSCGDYEVRTAKAIKNPNNRDDMCRICNKARQTLRWRERVLNCGTNTPNYLCNRKDFLDIGYWAGNKETALRVSLSNSWADFMSGPPTGQSPKFLDQMRAVLRVKGAVLNGSSCYG
jgi:hypothetical protein